MNEVLEHTKTSEGINALEKIMLDQLEPAIEELEHVHTPGLYGRKWSAKAGTLWISAIHKVCHQFVILKGALSVWVNGQETYYEAPFNGITQPGTRRVLYIFEDTDFMTFHPNPDNLNEVEFIELVTEKHENSLFSEEDEKLLATIRSNIEQKYLTT